MGEVGAGEDASVASGAGALVACSFVAHAAKISASGARLPIFAAQDLAKFDRFNGTRS